MPQGKICIGTVTGVHGVRGLVKLKSFATGTHAFRNYGQITDEAGKPFGVEILSALKEQYLARIEGITDRERAIALKGTRLYVDRAALPATDASEFYHADLLGMEAMDTTGKRLGKVSAIHDFGAGDVIEISGGAAEVMLPFTRNFVPEIDLQNRRVVIAAYEETQ